MRYGVSENMSAFALQAAPIIRQIREISCKETKKRRYQLPEKAQT